MITYKDLLILKLSKAAQWKNEREMFFLDKFIEEHYNCYSTCEFIDLESRKYKIRRYRKEDETIWAVIEYMNEKANGNTEYFFSDGRLMVLRYYEDGKLIERKESK